MKLAKLLLATAAATALIAAPAAWAKDVKKIGLAVPNLQADFFNQIKIGVENYAKEKGIEVIVVDAKNDTATQVSQVQDLIARHRRLHLHPRRCGRCRRADPSGA